MYLLQSLLQKSRFFGISWLAIILFFDLSNAKGADVLIFYANGGHEATTQRLESLFKQSGVSTEKYNVFDLYRLGLGDAHHKTHLLGMRYMPNRWDKEFYKFLDKADHNVPLTEFPYGKHLLDKKKALALLREKKPKVILVDVQFMMEVFAHLKKDGEIGNIPLGFIPTDYGTDTYFTKLLPEIASMTFAPDLAWEQAVLKNGIAPSKVMTTGLPSSPKTLETLSLKQIEELREKVGFSKGIPTVILSGGSAGLADFEGMISSIRKTYGDRPIQILAGTGKNYKAFQTLVGMKKTLPSNIHLHIMGFNKDLPLIMKYFGDVIVTKPGGLTITEVATLGKPLILLQPAAAQEKGNLRHFEQNGMAIGSLPNEVGESIKSLLDDREAKNRMLLAQKRLAEIQNHSKIISWTLAELTQQKQTGTIPWFLSETAAKRYQCNKWFENWTRLNK